MGRVNYWRDKNVLVTGANGFVGSWLTEELLHNKAKVTAVIRDKIPDSYLILSGSVDKINIVDASITDYDQILRALNEYNIDTVFHLAAQAIVTTANKNPLSTLETNIKGTWTLLEACKNIGKIERIIVASSDKAYGVQKDLPYKEDSPLLGLYPYDASKACTDIIARSYFTTYGLPTAVTRCANTYGGGDLNFSRIIPDTIKSVLFNNEPIIRSDGTPERDYLYIKDAIKAYLTLAQNIGRAEVSGRAFNFGSGIPISVLDVVNKIIRITKKNIKPKVLSSAKNEIDRQYLSSEKAKKVLDWEPMYDLESGLEETVAWYKHFLKL